MPLFGYPFINKSFDAFLVQLQAELKKQQFQWCMTLNPEIVVGAQNKPELKAFIQKGLCVADGAGLRLAHTLIHRQTLEKITGIDLVFALLEKGGFSFYCVGATSEVIEKTKLALSQQYPHSKLVGCHHGYFSETEEVALIRSIAQAAPDFVLVGMGFPKQEQFLMRLSQQATRGIGIGVGGVLDVVSGEKKKAPPFIRAIGLEWAYRGFSEPKRMKRWGFIPRFFKLLWKEWVNKP